VCFTHTRSIYIYIRTGEGLGHLDGVVQRVVEGVEVAGVERPVHRVEQGLGDRDVYERRDGEAAGVPAREVAQRRERVERRGRHQYLQYQEVVPAWKDRSTSSAYVRTYVRHICFDQHDGPAVGKRKRKNSLGTGRRTSPTPCRSGRSPRRRAGCGGGVWRRACC
jgi:hypothetical protein